MFQTAILASGSKGNCTVVRTRDTKILVDAGLPGNRISAQLASISLDESRIRALIISHEHSDHVAGAGIIARKYNIPVYISRLTYEAVKFRLGRLPKGNVFFQTGQDFRIGDIVVHAFSSSHDVVDGCNFIFQKEDEPLRKLALATDLGYATQLLINRLRNATTIILESNHDTGMLLEGPYPWHLKQRVHSRQGHLSNEQAVGVISQVIHPGLKNLILAHLSEQNNSPDLAYNIMKQYLQEIRFDLNLFISLQNEPTPIFDI
ncbi:MAG: MBL fold metallo-hydrolase [Candidatus Cloacimonetes bacterium]|nr:MBL fold metallo-hydrolase [Candidatus Cloacimonadota bacterium]